MTADSAQSIVRQHRRELVFPNLVNSRCLLPEQTDVLGQLRRGQTEERLNGKEKGEAQRSEEKRRVTFILRSSTNLVLKDRTQGRLSASNVDTATVNAEYCS